MAGACQQRLPGFVSAAALCNCLCPGQSSVFAGIGGSSAPLAPTLALNKHTPLPTPACLTPAQFAALPKCHPPLSPTGPAHPCTRPTHRCSCPAAAGSCGPPGCQRAAVCGQSPRPGPPGTPPGCRPPLQRARGWCAGLCWVDALEIGVRISYADWSFRWTWRAAERGHPGWHTLCRDFTQCSLSN